MHVNPEELKKRYEDLKKVRHLLLQKEHEKKEIEDKIQTLQ